MRCSLEYSEPWSECILWTTDEDIPPVLGLVGVEVLPGVVAGVGDRVSLDLSELEWVPILASSGNSQGPLTVLESKYVASCSA
jgi:hypothetical protein